MNMVPLCSVDQRPSRSMRRPWSARSRRETTNTATPSYKTNSKAQPDVQTSTDSPVATTTTTTTTTTAERGHNSVETTTTTTTTTTTKRKMKERRKPTPTQKGGGRRGPNKTEQRRTKTRESRRRRTRGGSKEDSVNGGAGNRTPGIRRNKKKGEEATAVRAKERNDGAEPTVPSRFVTRSTPRRKRGPTPYLDGLVNSASPINISGFFFCEPDTNQTVSNPIPTGPRPDPSRDNPFQALRGVGKPWTRYNSLDTR